MRQRHIIDKNLAVVTWETLHPAPRSSEERYSYLVEYKDTADKPRETEILNGFFSPGHCIQDALASLDMLDLRPEPPKATPAPRITQRHHIHFCKQACGVQLCVNPACYSKEEFPRKVAEIICPACGGQTGNHDFLERRRFAIVELIPLVIERASAA